MTTGQRIKTARKKAGITQAELGKILGVSGSMIAQYETDKRNPKYDTLKRIATALDVEWLDLVPEEQQGQTVIDGIKEKLKTAGPFQRITIEEARKAGFMEPLPTPLDRITHDVSQMTDEGQNKVADYAADILPRYRRQDAPEPPAGTNTTPPPDAPEPPLSST